MQLRARGQCGGSGLRIGDQDFLCERAAVPADVAGVDLQRVRAVAEATSVEPTGGELEEEAAGLVPVEVVVEDRKVLIGARRVDAPEALLWWLPATEVGEDWRHACGADRIDQ